ncbi:major facilitator superfamily domain-containing protein [Lasiosphaeria ovina]|uniref:Major facilitator superfamily domain-containing protein n=1 Tax=Lasiosphaeria ovina TaxID=92902 RepID=A0AAE0K6Q7_9PEZI|nr:major facilitator superfamily domain-containing protein [Lasiosphaeria ovina]
MEMWPKGGLVDDNSSKSEDVLSLQDLDLALNRKMPGEQRGCAARCALRLIQSLCSNQAIEELGWARYHTKLFFLNGFGYAVDSLVLLLQSAVAGPAFREFGRVGYEKGLTVSAYGFGADIIGRRLAFNVTLLICSAATIIAGGMPNWASLGFFVACIGLGAGGNLVLDTTVFLEYPPGSKQWALILMAAWWGLGQAIMGFIAWGFSGKYVMFTSGAIVLVMSILRMTVIRLKETPLDMGEDAKVVETLQFLATKHGRPCSLTLEKLDACGVVTGADSRKRFSLALCGANLNVSTFDSWRNYALTNIISIFGPILAAWMCETPILGRKYTMVIGALMTVAFLFAYTAVRTGSQDVGCSYAIGFCLNVYYGTLYAYTPDVLPSAHRATSNGVAVACNRTMGIISAVIATASDTSTTAPIFICGALLVAMSVVSTAFPFEPYGRRSS